jgi:hypothetical protein
MLSVPGPEAEAVADLYLPVQDHLVVLTRLKLREDQGLGPLIDFTNIHTDDPVRFDLFSSFG